VSNMVVAPQAPQGGRGDRRPGRRRQHRRHPAPGGGPAPRSRTPLIQPDLRGHQRPVPPHLDACHGGRQGLRLAVRLRDDVYGGLRDPADLSWGCGSV
jgi:hypothetical protein